MSRQHTLVVALAALALGASVASAAEIRCNLKPAKLPNGCTGLFGYNAQGDMVGFYRTAGRYAVLRASKTCSREKFDIVESYRGDHIKLVGQPERVLDDTCKNSTPAQ